MNEEYQLDQRIALNDRLLCLDMIEFYSNSGLQSRAPNSTSQKIKNLVLATGIVVLWPGYFILNKITTLPEWSLTATIFFNTLIAIAIIADIARNNHEIKENRFKLRDALDKYHFMDASGVHMLMKRVGGDSDRVVFKICLEWVQLKRIETIEKINNVAFHMPVDRLDMIS